ncbi:hypothetical protein DCAR_0520734 [Daucus carota subsp. sativus]|uniref:F-box domain-containing protein n=1 Tax=Daucus carota subsp. sativus TaxID=79200 RepID=A0AAF0X6G1_DAUCS|nr:hypothetical protein DCAR_0520734 [Daucus carota subsp. sativus]
MLSSPIKPKVSPCTKSWWFKNNTKTLDNVIFSVQNLDLPKQPNKATAPQEKCKVFDHPKVVSDRTSLLSDEILLQILSRLSQSERNSVSLVSKRWLNLLGSLVRSVKLLDWDFLLSGRVFTRFPNLTHVDLVNACVLSPQSSYILLTNQVVSFQIDSNVYQIKPNIPCIDDKYSRIVELGLKILASRYPNLGKLVVVNACELGLLSVAEGCPVLQELELHMCNDQVLRAIAAFQNLQTLKLIGNVVGIYNSLVSDLGLTILAQGCKSLLKLELVGCGGSYEGMKAIGQCCLMLEELTLSDHRFEGAWLPALAYYDSLKTLRVLSCKCIDRGLRADEVLDLCPALERLHLERCQLRDKQSVGALFLVCRTVKEVVIKNCWGLDDEIFSTAHICRRVSCLSLEGCSRLTTIGLEAVIHSWKELQSINVISCSKVKDSEVTPMLATLFSSLKDFKWRPDSKSLVSANRVSTGIGKRGKSFRKAQDWKFLSGA